MSNHCVFVWTVVKVGIKETLCDVYTTWTESHEVSVLAITDRPFESSLQPLLKFKTSLRAKSFLWISVLIHIEIRTNYRYKIFALRLALKERPKGTRDGLLQKRGHLRKCLSHHLHKWFSINTPSTHLGSTILLVIDKSNAIPAVRQSVRFHPLHGVLPTLSRDARHFGKRAKINLQPLTSISPLSAPGPSHPALSAPVESTAACSAVEVLVWRGAHHGAGNAHVLNSERHIAFI